MSLPNPSLQRTAACAAERKPIDDDGAQILSASGEVVLGKPEPGEIIQANALLTLNNLSFPHPGRYMFKILLNQEHKVDVLLKVIQTKETSAPSLSYIMTSAENHFK